jgi:GNAT superfamily N-acetyltransferase
MSDFHQADLSLDRERIQELFSEYLQWMNLKVSDKLGIGFDVKAKVDEDMAELHVFSPPLGRIIIATVNKELAGIGCLRMIGEQVGEVKRMYVRPFFRGRGIGRTLLDTLINEATTMGCRILHLESAWFMEEAQSLYRSSGFKEIPPYQGTEVPEEIHHLWLFMEKDLEAEI